MVSRSPLVLVDDPITFIPWSYELERRRLRDRGVRLLVPRSEKSANDAWPKADIVIANDRAIGADQIAKLRHCIGIVCYGVGTDQVDTERAAAAGIRVRNVYDYCTEEVADHALALLLAAERRLFPLVETEASDWNSDSEQTLIHRLRGQTLGIIGAGRIGKAVASRALSFGFQILFSDPYVTHLSKLSAKLVALDELLRRSDAVVVCAALTTSSRHLLDTRAFSRLRRGAIIVNVARGGLIDEAALARALKSGRCRYAGLDVRETEPPDRYHDPLGGAPNLILTPHIAAASVEARIALHEGCAREVLLLLEEAGRLSESG